MKKVALLGDSIRLIGYGTLVPKLLSGKFEVWQPDDNCRFCYYLLRVVYDNLDILSGCDVIHFNSGEWDVSRVDGVNLFTPPDVYADTILRIAELLKPCAKRVIFATTTPVKSAHIHNSNKDIIAYNQLVVPKLKQMGVEINDLYTIVNNNISDYIRDDDGIHLTAEGIQVCAKEVARLCLKNE